MPSGGGQSDKGQSRMNWPVKRTVLAVLLLGAAALVICMLFPREPSWEGTRLSQWLADFDGQQTETRLHASEALRRIGADAVPFIIARLRQHDSPLKLKVVGLLKRQTLVDVHFLPAEKWQRRALVACDALGPAAKGALPALEKLLDDKRSAPHVAYVMARIGPDAIPALTKATTNETRAIRLSARVCLDLLQTHSEVLFPAPGGSPQDSDFNRRISAYHVKVLRAAFLEYKAQHPEAGLPGSMDRPPPPSIPPDFDPTQDLSTNRSSHRQ